MKRILPFIVVLAIIGIAAYYYKAYHTPPSIAADENEFISENGTHVKIADLKGKYVLINYFQTWCPSCIREMPSIDQLLAVVGKDKLAVLIVSDEEAGKIWHFRDKYCNTLDYYRSAKSFDGLRILVYPTTYLFNPQGEVIFSKLESFNWSSDEVVKLIR